MINASGSWTARSISAWRLRPVRRSQEPTTVTFAGAAKAQAACSFFSPFGAHSINLAGRTYRPRRRISSRTAGAHGTRAGTLDLRGASTAVVVGAPFQHRGGGVALLLAGVLRSRALGRSRHRGTRCTPLC